MQNNYETYTYTARSANDPTKVVTFTLYDHHMRVNLTGVLEQAGMVVGAEEKPAEMGRQLSTQAKPVMMKMVESFSGPVHVSDVEVRLEDQRLKVVMWQRITGFASGPGSIQHGAKR